LYRILTGTNPISRRRVRTSPIGIDGGITSTVPHAHSTQVARWLAGGFRG